MSISVKICGISSEEALEAAIEAGAEYAGFVFFERSPRNLSLERAGELIRFAGGRIKSVALTVDAENAAIEAIMGEISPAFLQLHGGETVERVEEIRRLASSAGIIKAVHAGSPGDIDSARKFEPLTDILLFDSQPGSRPDALPGGNGLTFDWTWLAGASLRPNFMLSGGLNAGNLIEALSASGAMTVDVSSGVETSPGVKNPELIRQFIRTARSFAPDGTVFTGTQKEKKHVSYS